MPLILIILAIATFFVFIDPLYKEVKVLKQKKADNDKMLELAEQLQRKREQLQNDYNAIKPLEREQLAKLLPDTVDNVRLILDINNIADDYNVAIKNILVSSDEAVVASETQTTVADVGTISLSFSITATYDIYLNLLKDLEEALRLVDIRSLEIGRGEGIFYDYSITLDTYWLR